ncbi:MAG TPA: hypothetical protein VJQ26_04825, partial [Ktedonobacteraceae bacterium]|nr:hypothetical protein [Ktedonobacteraceae bacterium]
MPREGPPLPDTFCQTSRQTSARSLEGARGGGLEARGETPAGHGLAKRQASESKMEEQKKRLEHPV